MIDVTAHAVTAFPNSHPAILRFYVTVPRYFLIFKVLMRGSKNCCNGMPPISNTQTMSNTVRRIGTHETSIDQWDLRITIVYQSSAESQGTAIW